MKLLVVTRSPGRAPVKRTVVADWVRVGRNASCEIHLRDPRIALEQGMIVHRDGLVYLEGEGPASVGTTRKSVRTTRLAPGQPVEIGPYRLEAIEAPAGYDGAVAVERTRAPEASEGLASRLSRPTLASLGLPKRGLAWLLALAVLVAFLAIPAARVLDLPWKEASRHPVVGDRFWNPGPLLLAHQPIESRCETCHEVAFEHVKDRACLECHAAIGRHVEPALRPAALEAARCTRCHRDHKGVKPTHRDDDGLCVACHRDLRQHAPRTAALDAADFRTRHPEFRVSVARDGALRRVRQGTQVVTEATSLAFPHSVHLDPKGVRSPVQGRMVLECRSCHEPDASRRGFEPVTMAKHCQECHALRFEPAVSTREVPHGKPEEALVVIREFYANLALNGVRDSFQKAFGVPGEGLLRRVGAPGEAERRNALALAHRKAERVAAELFEVRVCKTCHAVARNGDSWTVAPLPPRHGWMPHASFDHRTHAHAKCASCHDAARSKSAADVAMPRIADCRECHGGSRPVEGKVTSNCLLCHGFHDAKHPWDPGFRPRDRGRLAQGAANAR